ncbi:MULTISPECIES: hypothetical protein [unclassified Streptomyces]|uniref:hypothetical protein n=1 Tax=unclassified Streptomyces TaxID=2593676 RepID=UPI002366B51F|nr:MULTISPECIES: hypothetical protein [unclassified Streptomyces]MDF3141423.1 hypothetical protein [Streptomyces sp. T21Q-yed]WDF35314.1 hypothetical protein PBV52_00065 [Streptomyces sp. T12]WDF44474.1 hypothetical protein PBV52_50735 [Streptomyces sp. T12]
MVDDDTVSLRVADDEEGSGVIRNQVTDPVREVRDESAGQVRKHPGLFRMSGITVRLEQDPDGDIGPVPTAVGGLEGGVPVE